jgi:hypothetical protein
MAIQLTALPREIEDVITQSLEGVNNACLQMRQRGLTLLLPERVSFEIEIAQTDDDGTETKADTGTKKDTGTKTDTGTSTSLTTFGDINTTTDKSGGGFTNTRVPSGDEVSVTNIAHPSILTSSSGGDTTQEDMNQKTKENGTN